MKRLKLTCALFMSLAAMLASSGCVLLPLLPLIPEVAPMPASTATIPPELSEAAERILPSTVIIDTRFVTGTGWVFDASGIIVTNHHVIKDARNVTVILPDGRRFRATRIASDPISDLAVLFIDAADLPAAVIGASTSLRPGDVVVAIGNSNGNGISVKTGRVTRLNMTVGIEGQDFYGLIENSAPIQHGDSGGPLVNREGEIVGISNAKVTGLREIAYAINIDSALPILYQLITTGTVSWPYLGIVGTDNLAGRGALIQEITIGGPADVAGLRAGDIIMSMDDTPVAGMAELRREILSQQIGQPVIITYRRGDTVADTVATLIQRPAS